MLGLLQADANGLKSSLIRASGAAGIVFVLGQDGVWLQSLKARLKADNLLPEARADEEAGKDRRNSPKWRTGWIDEGTVIDALALPVQRDWITKAATGAFLVICTSQVLPIMGLVECGVVLPTHLTGI